MINKTDRTEDGSFKEHDKPFNSDQYFEKRALYI